MALIFGPTGRAESNTAPSFSNTGVRNTTTATNTYNTSTGSTIDTMYIDEMIQKMTGIEGASFSSTPPDTYYSSLLSNDYLSNRSVRPSWPSFEILQEDQNRIRKRDEIYFKQIVKEKNDYLDSISYLGREMNKCMEIPLPTAPLKKIPTLIKQGPIQLELF